MPKNKKQKEQEKLPKRNNNMMIYAILATLLLAGLGVLERNKIITIIGGLGFIVVIIRLIYNSVMEDVRK